MAVRSISQSRMVVAFLIYLLVNFAIDCWRPLRYVAIEGRPFLDQHSYSNKSADLKRLTKSPDVLILGSSLAMSAIATADYSFRQKPFPPFFSAKFTTYTEAAFLKQQAGLELSYFNYACPGYLISHDLKLLSEVLAKGNPKLIIFMVAPRDFIDNLLFAHEANTTDEESPEKVVSKLLRLYAVRGDLSYLFKRFVRGLYEHWENPLKDMISTKTIDNRLEKFELYADEAAYIRRYSPIDWKRYKQQVNCLVVMLASCKSRKVPVLVVNMPLPECNRKLLDRQFYSQYMTMLAEESRLAGATFLNLQSGPYVDDDFRDYAHLRHSGGLKCCTAIAEAVARILKSEGR